MPAFFGRHVKINQFGKVLFICLGPKMATTTFHLTPKHAALRFNMTNATRDSLCLNYSLISMQSII